MSIKFCILGNPISSKNSIRSGITKSGRNYTYVNKNVKDYRDNALGQLMEQKHKYIYDNMFNYTVADLPIQTFCEASFLFCCNDNRKRDLVNLIQCPCDLLQQAGIILNDYLIVSLDGSRIMEVDKNNPRTEIIISLLKE